MSFDYTPGSRDITAESGRRLLDVGEWVDTITMLPQTVCCLRCNDLVFNRRDFDARMWQRHRESCSGISNMIMKAVVNKLVEQVNR
ncbi:hypothetical protein ARMGADRAFT_435614 [Armillaria gallica]|uniref:Uncharacterized protein n=1 Tax=Armillaria gallica TaxID=47427 RepID=A0A2H3D9X9_ARMGA|nr:hypothetical protein ARMGADRAFT_435614 [Armillaria gallica]